jgi:hypothetical protein
MNLIQLDVDPQQTILLNCQIGLQIVATINMENLMDSSSILGKDQTALLLGRQLIELLKTKGTLSNSIDLQKYIQAVCDELELE